MPRSQAITSSLPWIAPDVFEHLAHERAGHVIADVLIGLGLEQSVSHLARQPGRLGRGAREGHDLTVLGEQRAGDLVDRRQDVVPEPDQEQRGACLHGLRPDDPTPRRQHPAAAIREDRVQGRLHHEAGQPLHERVGPRQVDFALAHRQLEPGPDLCLAPCRLADRGGRLVQVEEQRLAAPGRRPPVTPHGGGHELLHVGRGTDGRADGLNLLGNRPVIELVLGEEGSAPLLAISGTLPLVVQLFHLGLQVIVFEEQELLGIPFLQEKTLVEGFEHRVARRGDRESRCRGPCGWSRAS